ncbi:hypothetical protein LTR37_015020 [Vermiconidia calcicola]|uniref:Uncharacterized protein n=1 Tax=Vermiconidia calcicola TaxID=1690605 RepID=A0ACC3MRV5_9PEZI|nr:hypothetical protein LTR37_015020 [Vermiconidia calcicola]
MDTEMLDVLADDNPGECHFFKLPRELRDIIYGYACSGNTYNTRSFTGEKTKVITFPLGSNSVLSVPTLTTSAELQGSEQEWPCECGRRFTRKVNLDFHIQMAHVTANKLICGQVDLTNVANGLPNTICDGSAVCRQMLEEVTPILISNTTFIFRSPAEFEIFMERYGMIRDRVVTAHVWQESGLFQPSAAFCRIVNSCPRLVNFAWYVERAISHVDWVTHIRYLSGQEEYNTGNIGLLRVLKEVRGLKTFRLVMAHPVEALLVERARQVIEETIEKYATQPRL